MEALSPSTINVRLSAVRKLVGEARRNNMIGSEEAASLTDVPNISRKGTPPWQLAKPRAGQRLLAVPDRSTLKGKRDYLILARLVGCALRRNKLAELDVETIQQREGRWVLADLEGKGRRIRTVAVPIWVKHGINAWMTAAASKMAGCCVRFPKAGKINRDTLSDWAVCVIEANWDRALRRSAGISSKSNSCSVQNRTFRLRCENLSSSQANRSVVCATHNTGISQIWFRCIVFCNSIRNSTFIMI
ncbi:hypothetical protein [Tunturiibacter lichenicola]|uniref:hypothetical protein n=1 Tax=Tunturiibacter lichenicola TaxID=2051959 RepID=UPI003D9BF21D